MAKRRRNVIEWDHPLRGPLDRAAPRPEPDGERDDKKNYAERLSREAAIMIGSALRPAFPAVTPTVTGLEQESPTGADGGKKRLDVKVWDDRLGLVMSVSIKTYSFQDYSKKTARLGRFTKNILRNDHELRAEADVVHRRQPFSVLVAVVFMNANAALDGNDKTKSSFAHGVFTLRKRSGRAQPDDPRYDRFERVFIALYFPDGEDRGACFFFDVEDPPPMNGLPRKVIDLKGFVQIVEADVRSRNRTEAVYEDGGEDLGGDGLDDELDDDE